MMLHMDPLQNGSAYMNRRQALPHKDYAAALPQPNAIKFIL